MRQNTGSIQNKGNLITYPVFASQDDNSDGGVDPPSDEVGVGGDENDSGDGNGDEVGDNAGAEIADLGSVLTDSVEYAPSITSRDFSGEKSPLVQGDSLSSGGDNNFARECPDEGPIPP